jgi:hypothetical protein
MGGWVLVETAKAVGGAGSGNGSWWSENWFSIVQTVGIVTGFALAAIALWADLRVRREDVESRRVETLMLTTQYHRDIWSRMLNDQSLDRVLDPDADLAQTPLSEKERMFCTFLVLHLFATFEARKAGVFRADWSEARDLGEFFSLPIPSAVWDLVKDYQNPEFAEFLESARNAEGALSGE